MNNNFDEIASCIPIYSQEFLNLPQGYKDKTSDIRFSVGFPPRIYMGREKYVLQNCKSLTKFDMQELVYQMCENSVYKHIEEIKNGFISVKNRFRAGLCGTAVLENGKILNISDISSVIIRVPRIIYGCAQEIINSLADFSAGVLIVGEPSSGKTTALRDIMQVLTEKRLVVLDERWEITGIISKTDIDILYNYPKMQAISHAVRNLGATHIICDEIELCDFEAIENASACGVSIIATVHGDLKNGLRPLVKKLLQANCFSHVVELEGRDRPCKLRKVWTSDELLENYRCDTNLPCLEPFGTMQKSKNQRQPKFL
ncbi:MAG: hypothetical protein R3Y33_06320 [Clostridia bacterium]